MRAWAHALAKQGSNASRRPDGCSSARRAEEQLRIPEDTERGERPDEEVIRHVDARPLREMRVLVVVAVRISPMRRRSRGAGWPRRARGRVMNAN